jgi:glycosyltransferase involved in cell wall biosynthesis
MKICFVTEYFPTGSNCDIRGGAEAVAFFEAKHLSGKHEIEVITSFEHGTKREDRFENLSVIRCGRARKYVQKDAFTDRLLFLYGAYRYGKKQKYDLVVGFNILTYLVAWKISKKLKVPCIVRYHDVLIGKWVHHFGVTGWIGEWVEKYTLSKRFAAIIAVSNYTAGKLEKYIDKRENLFVVHNGVELPSKLSPKYSVPTVVCISRLVTYKHVDDLLKALALLKTSLPEMHCIIIGTGPEEFALKHLAESLGIQERVTFSGYIQNREELLNTIGSSQLLCLPSRLEGFGLVVLESMACGVPFVAAAIPSVIEFSAMKGGLFFQPGNTEELAEKIRRILTNEELQKELGSEGRQKATEFRWSDLSLKTDAIYVKTVKEWRAHEDG